MSKGKLATAAMSLAAAGVAILFGTAPATGLGVREAAKIEPKADHRDGSLIVIDPAADLADVYAFLDPNDTSFVVLAMTVNPFQAPGNSQYFSPDVLYQFKIDNGSGKGGADALDAEEDLVIQARFTKASDAQKFSIVGPVKPKKAGNLNSEIKLKKGELPIIGSATSGEVTTDASKNISVFAGLRDDPFFFDLVFGEKAAGVIKGPAIAVRTPAVDYFAGFNVSILAIRLKADTLKGASGNKVRIWATTSRSTSTKRSAKADIDEKDAATWVQVDRMGLPTVNVVLTLPKPFNAVTGDPLTPEEATINNDLKDNFNRSAPADDMTLYGDEVKLRLSNLSGSSTYAEQTVGAILPDTLTIDLTSTAGFSSLNGRAPADDVIDKVLSIVLNNPAATDNLPANDVAFSTTFPFFAPPHQATEIVPARNK